MAFRAICSDGAPTGAYMSDDLGLVVDGITVAQAAALNTCATADEVRAVFDGWAGTAWPLPLSLFRSI